MVGCQSAPFICPFVVEYPLLSRRWGPWARPRKHESRGGGESASPVNWHMARRGWEEIKRSWFWHWRGRPTDGNDLNFRCDTKSFWRAELIGGKMVKIGYLQAPFSPRHLTFKQGCGVGVGAGVGFGRSRLFFPESESESIKFTDSDRLRASSYSRFTEIAMPIISAIFSIFLW